METYTIQDLIQIGCSQITLRVMKNDQGRLICRTSLIDCNYKLQEWNVSLDGCYVEGKSARILKEDGTVFELTDKLFFPWM